MSETPPSAAAATGAGARDPKKAPLAPARRRDDKTIPKEAKVAFGVGCGLLLVLAMLPFAGAIADMFSSPAPPPHPGAPAATGGGGGPSEPRPTPIQNGGGGGGGGGGPGPGEGGKATADRPADDEPPMDAGAFAVLRSLKASFVEAARRTGQGVAAMLPDGALEGSTSDTATNLNLAQMKLAQYQVQSVKVLGEEPGVSQGMRYRVEVSVVGPDGGNYVTRGNVEIKVTGDKATIVKCDRFSAIEPPTAAAVDTGPAQPTEEELAAQRQNAARLGPMPRGHGAPPPEGSAPAKPKYPYELP